MSKDTILLIYLAVIFTVGISASVILHISNKQLDKALSTCKCVSSN